MGKVLTFAEEKHGSIQKALDVWQSAGDTEIFPNGTLQFVPLEELARVPE